MHIAGGAQKVEQDAAVLGISAADKVGADRSLAAFMACEAAALATRGMSNPNRGVQARIAGALRLGEQVGSAVMGPEKWAQYITTSAKATKKGDKPLTATTTQQ